MSDLLTILGLRKKKEGAENRYDSSLKECGNCKHYAQGATCSYCDHPEQTNEDRKGYCYYISFNDALKKIVKK
jgi:hypothetical protein